MQNRTRQNVVTKRKALAILGVSSAAVWSKPVVESVLLPSHAQSSAPEAMSPLLMEGGLSLSENAIVLSRTSISGSIIISLTNTGNVPLTISNAELNFSYSPGPPSTPPVVPPGTILFPFEPLFVDAILIAGLEIQPLDVSTFRISSNTSYLFFTDHPYIGSGEVIFEVESDIGRQIYRETFTIQTLP